MRKLLVLLVLFLPVPHALAVISEFDDIALDGEGGPPFIRFDVTGQSSKFIVGFSDNFGIWTGNSYSIRMFSSAPSNALTVDSDGVSVKNVLNVNDDDNIVDIDLEHTTTTQTFGIISLNENTGLHGGGIGLHTDTSSFPFYVFSDANSETLAVREQGVGIGSYEPQAALHVYADGNPMATAKVLIENNLPGTPITREMFSLVNNGGSRFSFTDTSIGSEWSFSSNNKGYFSISKNGTGGSEFRIEPSGRVLMGPGGVAKFDLKANGNLVIAGTLTQSSDKNLKTAFVDVKEKDVLQRVAEMPVQTWQFKFDDPELRHMGPTAQDFYAAFELGQDEKTIAPVDGIGVCLAAIKALKTDSDQKDAAINALSVEIASQENELENQRHELNAHRELVEKQQQLLVSLAARLNKLEGVDKQY